MFAFFWRKIKDFFITRSRLTNFSMVVLVLFITIGIFGLVSPVGAKGVGDWLASGVSSLLLMLAAFIGKLLVLVIGVLLEIVSYNDFTNSDAVEKGWIVLRDLCNLFFILILLVIAFGTILKLETYKYNKLLGKLVIMIVLVNFSRMIAGFFIDISQVVLMTFANAFSAAAAANFTEGFKLGEMLGISGKNANAGGISPTELMSLSLLPVILLTVALFTMIAMVAVFLVRILMLWILVILSPIAYLLAVLPSTQQYSKQWWSNFIKWVTTGPILAFFIWFGLTLISGGDMVKLENTRDQLVTSSTSDLAINVSNVSDSQSLLSFVMAIGMFIVALITAQSLGGMAGGMAGKALSKLQGMGSGVLKGVGKTAMLPAKGAGELAKMGGRKIRRTWRDSSVGKYTNVGALVEGAKKRGAEVESISKEDATAQGQDLWNKRPESMGGGGDVVSAVETVQRRRERQAASEVSTLQKEQKSALLEKVWSRPGKQSETTRRALLQSLAAEGHIDDALNTKFFKEKAIWHEEVTDKKTGKKKLERRDGFKDKQRHVVDSNMSRSNFMRAAISRGDKRSTRAKDIDENSLGTLYDIQQAGIRNDHFEYAGEVMANPKTGKLALPETLDKDRMEHKNETIKAEISKPTDRKRIGNHPHNASVQKESEAKDIMRLVPFKPKELDANATEDQKKKYNSDLKLYTENKAMNDEFNFKSNYAKTIPKGFGEFSSSRLHELLGKLNSEDGTMMIHDDDDFKDQIKTMYTEHPEFVNAIQSKAGIKKWKIGKDGKELDSLDKIAKAEGWKTNPKYKTPKQQEEKRDEERLKKDKEDKEAVRAEIDQKQASIDSKREEVSNIGNEIDDLRRKSPMEDGSLGESDEKTIKEKTEKITKIEETIAKEETELTTLKSKTVTEETETTETTPQSNQTKIDQKQVSINANKKIVKDRKKEQLQIVLDIADMSKNFKFDEAIEKTYELKHHAQRTREIEENIKKDEKERVTLKYNTKPEYSVGENITIPKMDGSTREATVKKVLNDRKTGEKRYRTGWDDEENPGQKRAKFFTEEDLKKVNKPKTTEKNETTESASASTKTKADSHGAVDDAQYNIDNATAQLQGMPELKISRDSLNEFEDLINKLTIDVNTGDGIDANSFDTHINDIGSKLSETLVKAKIKPEDKKQVMDNYNQASSKLQIGTISEKTLQLRMIDALRRLSDILKR